MRYRSLNIFNKQSHLSTSQNSELTSQRLRYRTPNIPNKRSHFQHP
ncbi:hypothetical protein ACSQ6I_19280 [Anabaena sp. WFMT]